MMMMMMIMAKPLKTCHTCEHMEMRDKMGNGVVVVVVVIGPEPRVMMQLKP